MILTMQAGGRRIGCEGVDKVHLTAMTLVGLGLETAISTEWDEVCS